MAENRIGAVRSILKPELWLAAAVFASPLRAYGMDSPLGTITVFRVVTAGAWIMLVLKVLLESKVMLGRWQRFAVGLGVMNLLFILVALLYSPYLQHGDSATRVQVKLFGWSWVAAAVLVLNRADRLTLAVRALELSAVIPILVGLYQIVVYFQTGQPPALPLERFAVATEGKAVGVQYGAFLRPSGTFLEPNYYGYFLSVIAMITYAQVIRREFLLPAWSTRCLLALSLVLLAATLSMTAMIGFVAGLGVLWWIDSRARYIVRHATLAVFIATILAALGSLVPVLSNIVAGLALKASVRATQVDALFGRERFLVNVSSAVAQSYGMGAGFGGLAAHDALGISTAHSAALTVLGEQGVLAFVILVSTFLWMVIRLLRAGRSGGAGLRAGLGAAILSLLVGNLGYDAMFSYDASWVVIGIGMAAAAMRTESANLTSRRR